MFALSMCFRELTYNAGRKKNAAAAPSPLLLPLSSRQVRAARVHLPVRLDRHEEQVDRQHLEAVGVLVLDAGVPQDDDDGPLSAARAQVCVRLYVRLLSLR